MNRDDIIRMAREGKAIVEQVHAYVSLNKTDYTSEDIAKMVRDFIAAEREECAKILDSVDNYANPMTATDCADAIRARGQE